MKTYTCKIYRDKKKDFRWKLVASNGRVVAEGGEGYKRESTMKGVIKGIFLDGHIDFPDL